MTLTPSTLTFTEGGDTMMCFNISVPENNVLENNVLEGGYNITITLNSADPGVTLDPQARNISILDTTSKKFNMTW